MASRIGLFTFCFQLALVGLTACGPSMDTPDLKVADPDFEIMDPGAAGDAGFLDTFLAEDRVFNVMILPESTPYAASAKLTLTSGLQYVLNVEWTTGKRETFSGDFEVVEDSIFKHFDFDNGEMTIMKTLNGDVECIHMYFDAGALRSTEFLLCE